MEYWIDGYFHDNWTGRAYYSHERGVYVPKFAVLRVEPDRIYITGKFARSILRASRVFDMTKKNDQLDLVLKNIINVKWVKPIYSGPPTSLP